MLNKQAIESQNIEIKEDLIETDKVLDDGDVMSFLSKKYGRDFKSLDDLVKDREPREEYPEDVQAFAKYKKETGRGIEDFIKLNKDFDKLSPEKLLKSYLSETNKELDSEDIDVMMEEYSYDEDFDNESEVKQKRILQKRKIAEAKEYFGKQKEQFGLPIERMGSIVPDDEKEDYDSYKHYMAKATTMEEEGQLRTKWFSDKTTDLFKDGFKGFEFEFDDQKLVYTPNDIIETRKSHSDPSSFAKKFLDDKGLLSDTAGYHKALAVAREPEKFAKFFFEQGRSSAIDKTMKGIKNIHMNERTASETVTTGGLKVRSMSEPHSGGLRVKATN